MKLGIVADIHGNDAALRAVLADAGRFAVDRWWALGDLAADLRRRRHPNAEFVSSILTEAHQM